MATLKPLNTQKHHFGNIGVKVFTSLTGEHACRAERTSLTLQQLSRVTQAALRYVLPPALLLLLLRQSVGESLNNSVNKGFRPNTQRNHTWVQPFMTSYRLWTSCYDIPPS